MDYLASHLQDAGERVHLRGLASPWHTRKRGAWGLASWVLYLWFQTNQRSETRNPFLVSSVRQVAKHFDNPTLHAFFGSFNNPYRNTHMVLLHITSTDQQHSVL